MRRRVGLGVLLFAMAFALGLWLWPSPAPPAVDPEVRAARRARAAEATRPRRPRPSSPAPAASEEVAPAVDDPVHLRDVACVVDGMMEGEQGVWVREPGIRAVRGRAVVRDGVLRLLGYGSRGESDAQILMPSWAPTPARVEFGVCMPSPLVLSRPARRLYGQVSPVGEAWRDVRVRCGAGTAWVDEQGAYSLNLDAEPCVAEAIRRDGALYARGPAVHVGADQVGDIPLDLALPEGRQAGMGIAIREVEEGIRVVAVHEGVARAAGVRRGSLVLAVDGVSTEGMSAEDFIELGTGAEGAPVALLIEEPGGALKTYTLVRAPVALPPGAE